MSVKGIKVPSPGGAFAKRSQVPPVSMPRSVFDLSKGHKTSLDSGLVVPLWVEEVLPGDTFRVKTTILMRLATLLYPLMDNLYLDVHFFFVPWRLVWSNTEKFFGQQENPADSISYSIPQFSLYLGSGPLGLHDYFGVNTYTISQFQVNSLQARGYRRIHNEWYRDQNLQNSVAVSLGDGPDSFAAYDVVLPRNKRGDYFTLALPWPQKGTVPVSFLPDNVAVSSTGVAPTFDQITGGSPKLNFNPITFAGSTTLGGSGANAVSSGNVAFRVGGVSGLEVDFATLGVASINAFRQANAMQVYLERNARGGTRYPEYLKHQWGVTSSDARLQRTEYLGGASAPVVVSPIAQVSSSLADNPLGKLSGVGSLSQHGAGFVKSFEEHGYVYALVSVRADLNYQWGCPRQFKRRTLFDVANPAFANVGEQPLFNYEIWYRGEGTDNPTGVFGYQERFAEYKQSYSMLTGNMRSEAAASYDVWHVAQDFSALPTLGDTFIKEVPAVDRVVATPFTDQWILDSVIDVNVARCLPLYGVPGLGGRF